MSGSPSENTSITDRISELPDHVLEYLTAKLTLRDAVRTKVLSARWVRVEISSRSSLVFDWINMFQTPQNAHIIDKHPCNEFRVRFVASVNQLLSSIVKTTTWRIRSFTIEFCLGVNYQDDVNNWVRIALRKGVHNLQLKLYCMKTSKLPYHFRLVSDPNLFVTQGQSLTALTLEHCSPGPCLTNTHTFGSLNLLKFAYLDLKDYDLTITFLCLKKLVTLEFFFCILPVFMSITPLACLQRFSVSLSSGVQRINILNPKLVYFCCECTSQVRITISDDILTLNIEELSFGGHRNSWEYIFTRLSRVMPKLTRLGIFSENDDSPLISTTMVTFPRVTYFSISLVFHLELSKIISALKAFPELRKLRIVDAGQVQVTRYEHENHTYEHLEEIEFCRFFATSNEIQVLIYFVKHAPSLKTLIVDPNLTREECQLVRQILQLIIARNVEIIFK